MLEPEGYDVMEASNGKAGMCLYRENSFDLIIIDLIMPGMLEMERTDNAIGITDLHGLTRKNNIREQFLCKDVGL